MRSSDSSRDGDHTRSSPAAGATLRLKVGFSHGLMVAIAGMLLTVSTAQGQQRYPIKPIRLIVPFAPGGGSDIVARAMAQKLAESFGVPVVVDNRPGAGGSVGTETAVRANPDGYTMVLVSTSYAANAALYKLSYDPVSDVTPIALIGETGFVVALHLSIPVTSIKELIAYDRANPGKLNYGSGGVGNSLHLVTELFNQAAGTRLTHVPYKGTGPALSGVLGGQIQLVFGGMPPTIPHVKSNRLRGIAVTTAARSNALPDTPTVGETVAGYEAAQWFAILGPKALSKGVIAQWNQDIERIVQLPDVKERMASEGMQPTGGSPERVREVLRRDVAKWQQVVKVAHIKAGS
jgi:tripartite-type tricarboxylate transporter receptor subunit TctC